MPRRRLAVVLVALALASSLAAADDFLCTEVLGVSVTGDWFGAGFEKGAVAKAYREQLAAR